MKTDLSQRVRQLAKEMTEGDPVTAAMLITVAKALEQESREATMLEIEKAAKEWMLGGPFYDAGPKLAEKVRFMRLQERKANLPDLSKVRGILK